MVAADPVELSLLFEEVLSSKDSQLLSLQKELHFKVDSYMSRRPKGIPAEIEQQARDWIDDKGSIFRYFWRADFDADVASRNLRQALRVRLRNPIRMKLDSPYISPYGDTSDAGSVDPSESEHSSSNTSNDESVEGVSSQIEQASISDTQAPTTSQQPLIHFLSQKDVFGRPIGVLNLSSVLRLPGEDEPLRSLKRDIEAWWEVGRRNLRQLAENAIRDRTTVPLQFVLIASASNVSYANLEGDLVKFLTSTLHGMFPGMCGVVHIVHVGWTASSLWSVAKRLLPAWALERVSFPNQAEIDQLFGGNDKVPMRECASTYGFTLPDVFKEFGGPVHDSWDPKTCHILECFAPPAMYPVDHEEDDDSSGPSLASSDEGSEDETASISSGENNHPVVKGAEVWEQISQEDVGGYTDQKADAAAGSSSSDGTQIGLVMPSAFPSLREYMPMMPLPQENFPESSANARRRMSSMSSTKSTFSDTDSTPATPALPKKVTFSVPASPVTSFSNLVPYSRFDRQSKSVYSIYNPAFGYPIGRSRPTSRSSSPSRTHGRRTLRHLLQTLALLSLLRLKIIQRRAHGNLIKVGMNYTGILFALLMTISTLYGRSYALRILLQKTASAYILAEGTISLAAHIWHDKLVDIKNADG